VNPGSHDLKENVYLLLRAVIRSSYFGETLPEHSRLLQMTRLPGLAIQEGLKRLVVEGAITPEGTTYRRLTSATKRRGRVAFLLNANLFSAWYGIFQDYLIGFEEMMYAADYEVFFHSDFSTVDNKLTVIQDCRRVGIAGLALASFTEPRLREQVVKHNLPAVIIGNASIHQQDLGCVCSDNYGGIESVVRFLIQQNHQHIAFYATGLRSHHGFQQRLAGYEQTMRAAGLKPLRDLAFSESHDASCARRAALHYLAMEPRPTAIACSADREAFELMAELQKSGVKVPEDVSVTGFDNTTFASLANPALTSVEIYARDIGRVAANYLLNEMQQAQMPVRLVLPTRLATRDSVRLMAAPVLTGISKKTDRIPLPEEEEILNF
jgi:LacI family transcriptional regulator